MHRVPHVAFWAQTSVYTHVYMNYRHVQGALQSSFTLLGALPSS